MGCFILISILLASEPARPRAPKRPPAGAERTNAGYCIVVKRIKGAPQAATGRAASIPHTTSKRHLPQTQTEGVPQSGRAPPTPAAAAAASPRQHRCVRDSAVPPPLPAAYPPPDPVREQRPRRKRWPPPPANANGAQDGSQTQQRVARACLKVHPHLCAERAPWPCRRRWPPPLAIARQLPAGRWLGGKRSRLASGRAVEQW